MKKISYKKIYLLTLIFSIAPLISYSQAFSDEIAGVTWGNPTIADTSITVRGTMVHTNNPPAPYRFQIEYGLPGSNPVLGEVASLPGDSEVLGFGPVLNSTEYLNAQNGFAITVNNLYPSQYYYFNLYEWGMSETAGQPVQDYFIAATGQPENITINFSPFQNGASTLSGAITLPSNYTPGVISGMPVGVYVLSAPSTGNTIN